MKRKVYVIGTGKGLHGVFTNAKNVQKACKELGVEVPYHFILSIKDWKAIEDIGELQHLFIIKFLQNDLVKEWAD